MSDSGRNIFSRSFGINKGITAFVGSGGKTTAMEIIADELSAQGSVIICTSTRIMKPDRIEILERIDKRMAAGTQVCIGVTAPENDKKLAPPVQTFEELTGYADYVLVEADGSKHLPLKAHAEYEPVIPKSTGKLIILFGASGINRPIEEVVHRPEIFRELTENEGDIATAKLIAKAYHKEKAKYKAFDTCLFINQADEGSEREKAADELAALLEGEVYIGALKSNCIRAYSQ